MTTWVRVACILALLAVLIPPAFPQTSQGSISGAVRDAQQAAVVGADVTAVELDKNTSVTVKTDAEGRFTFTNLLPGRYSIQVVAGGFKKLEREGVTLLANDKITVGVITLEVGSLTEQIEVKAVGQTLKTESAERSDAMTALELENLAVN